MMYIIQKFQRHKFEYKLNGSSSACSYINVFLNEVWENGEIIFQSFDYQEALNFIKGQEKIRGIIETQNEKGVIIDDLNGSNSQEEHKMYYNLVLNVKLPYSGERHILTSRDKIKI